ncbi:MAG TPA: hypothetical protein VGU71_22475 [Candidatus Dormibacteraeota bacterium]|nr:hypothetical protein [Candidatus Dormibacteraeota bacterium]
MSVATTQLDWRSVRASAGPPTSYNDPHRYAIFPEIGGHGWELCWMADADSGYDFMGWYRTVVGAKAEAEYQVLREEARG